MNVKNAVVGTVITVIIGGTAYSINQADVINNFADDTGLTPQQAEQYINDIGEDEFASFEDIGADYIEDGEGILDSVAEIDCVNYEYEWESSSLSCEEGKEQLDKIGNDSILLGQAYQNLDSDSASEDDIYKAITLIDIVNADYDLSIVSIMLDDEIIDENKKTGSYNKAILEAAADSN